MFLQVDLIKHRPYLLETAKYLTDSQGISRKSLTKDKGVSNTKLKKMFSKTDNALNEMPAPEVGSKFVIGQMQKSCSVWEDDEAQVKFKEPTVQKDDEITTNAELENHRKQHNIETKENPIIQTQNRDQQEKEMKKNLRQQNTETKESPITRTKSRVQQEIEENKDFLANLFTKTDKVLKVDKESVNFYESRDSNNKTENTQDFNSENCDSSDLDSLEQSRIGNPKNWTSDLNTNIPLDKRTKVLKQYALSHRFTRSNVVEVQKQDGVVYLEEQPTGWKHFDEIFMVSAEKNDGIQQIAVNI